MASRIVEMIEWLAVVGIVAMVIWWITMRPTTRPDAREPVPIRFGEIRGPAVAKFIEQYTVEHADEPGGAALDPTVVDNP